MIMERDPGGIEGRLVRIEQEMIGLRERVVDAQQQEARGQSELRTLTERLREAEGEAVRTAAEVGGLTRNLEEIQSLRERVGRFQSALSDARELLDVEVRQLRHELDTERENASDTVRRMQALEQAAADLRTRLGVFDDAMQRVASEVNETALRLSQIEGNLEAVSARIAANTDALRRSATATRAAESRLEAVERQLQALAERLELAMQNVRRATDLAETWETLTDQVEAMKHRVDDASKTLEEAKSVAAGARRHYETLEERIGDIERVQEQLRARAAHQEREVAGVTDRVDAVDEQTRRDQESFVTLQEKIRRRQIDDLEQEIRELKAYLRVRSDV